MEGLNGVIFLQAIHYFPVHPGQSLGGAAQHRPLHGGGGAEPRLARPAPVPPHRPAARPARLRRRRQPGVRQGVRRRGDAAAAQRQGDAGAAGLSAHHLDRHRRSDGLRHLRRPDRRRRRHHVGLGAGAEGQGLRHHPARRRRPRPAHARAARVGAGLCRRDPDPGPGAGAACRPAAAVVRHRVVVQPAARRLHPRPLRPRAGRQLGLHQEHAALLGPRRRHRRRDRRRHRLPGAAHPAARPAVARLGRQHRARRARRRAGHRLPARLLRREPARRHAARHLGS